MKPSFWFKRKVYGWGWTPASWQGWLATAIYLVLVILLACTVDKTFSVNQALFRYIFPLVLLTICLIVIAYTKGEKPRWQWGSKEGK